MYQIFEKGKQGISIQRHLYTELTKSVAICAIIVKAGTQVQKNRRKGRQ